jgi:hypothetical protein
LCHFFKKSTKVLIAFGWSQVGAYFDFNLNIGKEYRIKNIEYRNFCHSWLDQESLELTKVINL